MKDITEEFPEILDVLEDIKHAAHLKNSKGVNALINLAESLKKFSEGAESAEAAKEIAEKNKSEGIVPRIEPGKKKFKKDTIFLTVDSIPGVSPSYEDPWGHINPPDKNDTIYRKKKQ